MGADAAPAGLTTFDFCAEKKLLSEPFKGKAAARTLNPPR
jgi:hypothetical protein